MIWGAFCGTELKSNIYFVPSGSKIDSSSYTTTILDPLLIPFWHECCEEYGWARVVEDGAPGHKKYSIRCRERNNMDSIDWPPQSPDLNLIEALWAHMEMELGETFGRISDLKTLKEILKNTWDNTITRDILDNLIKSMPRRLAAVIAAGGDATPY
jgi:hypothetical protein